jgi:hypothetical protein
VSLNAFNELGQTLFSAPAGNWLNYQNNANMVPIAANGRAYVASYQQLSIFGLGNSGAAITAASKVAPMSSETGADVAE